MPSPPVDGGPVEDVEEEEEDGEDTEEDQVRAGEPVWPDDGGDDDGGNDDDIDDGEWPFLDTD